MKGGFLIELSIVGILKFLLTGTIGTYVIGFGVNFIFSILKKYLECNYSVDIDILRKHTYPFVSVYNYDYNLYAIDIDKYRIETKDNVVKNNFKVNAEGNKNLFPRKLISYLPIEFTEEQIQNITSLLVDETLVNDEEKSNHLINQTNNIGCNCTIYQSPNRDESPIDEHSRFVSNIIIRNESEKETAGYNKNNKFNQELHVNTQHTSSPKYYAVNIRNNNNLNIMDTSINTYFDNLTFVGAAEKIKNTTSTIINPEKSDRFTDILNHLLIIRTGVIFYNYKYIFHPHYIIKSSIDNPTNIGYYLPVIYPSTMEIMIAFCNFLNINTCKYLIMDSSTKNKENIDNNFDCGRLYTYPIREYNEKTDDPICIIISPSHTEGFSFVYNPALFAPALCMTGGDQEQVYGRILRKYSPFYSNIGDGDLRYDKFIYQYFGADNRDIEHMSNLSNIYGIGEESNNVQFSSNYIQIEEMKRANQLLSALISITNLDNSNNAIIAEVVTKVTDFSYDKRSKLIDMMYKLKTYRNLLKKYTIEINKDLFDKQLIDYTNEQLIDKLKDEYEQCIIIEKTKNLSQEGLSQEDFRKTITYQYAKYAEPAISGLWEGLGDFKNLLSYDGFARIRETIPELYEKLKTTAHYSFFATEAQQNAWLKTLKHPIINEHLHLDMIDSLNSLANKYFNYLIQDENDSRSITSEEANNPKIVPMDLQALNMNSIEYKYCDLMSNIKCNKTIVEIEEEEEQDKINESIWNNVDGGAPLRFFTPLCIENTHGNVAVSLISRPLVGVLNEKRGKQITRRNKKISRRNKKITRRNKQNIYKKVKTHKKRRR
jgi:hypothetical protein